MSLYNTKIDIILLIKQLYEVQQPLLLSVGISPCKPSNTLRVLVSVTSLCGYEPSKAYSPSAFGMPFSSTLLTYDNFVSICMTGQIPTSVKITDLVVDTALVETDLLIYTESLPLSGVLNHH